MITDMFRRVAAAGNLDRGRLKGAITIAGKLIGAWHLNLKIDGVVVARLPTHIELFGDRLPLDTNTPTPVSLLLHEPCPPLVDACGVQAVMHVLAERWASADFFGVTHAKRIIEDFGDEALEALILTLLSDNYTIHGVRGVPARDSVLVQFPHASTSETLDATVRPRAPATGTIETSEANL